MLAPPIVDVKMNLNKCGSRWDKESFFSNQGIRKTTVCQNNISVFLHFVFLLSENTPETNAWHVCMSVSVCQSDSMGQEEEDKRVEGVKEEEEEDGFIRALS